MPNRKLSIVTRLIDEVPEQYRESVDQAMVTWWTNIRPEGGLRLTRHGYEILNNILEMESWELDLTDKSRMDKRIILDLDRRLEWPYFLDFNPRKKSRRIVFFSSREALMATMYGDLRAWLNNVVDQK